MKGCVLFVGLALLLSACKSQEVTGGAAQNAMGLYAQGYNKLVNEVSGSIIKDYFGSVGEELPSDLGKVRLFSRHLNVRNFAYTQAKQSFEQANGEAPDTLKHLGPLADEVLKQADLAILTFEQAHKYYDADDFKDDQGAKAKELHSKMKSVRTAYYQAVGKLEDALDVIENQQMEADLKQYSNDTYGYWFRKMNLEAKRLMASSGKPEKFAKQLAALETERQGLDKFAKGKGDELHAAFKSYMGMTDRLHSSAKKLNRLAQEEKADAQKLGQEHRSMVNAYNSMVSVGNSLYDLEANGVLK